MSTKKTEKELAKELYDHRHDPGEWGEKAVQIRARPARTAVISCRLPLDEYDALEQAAQDAGESLSEFVRKAVAMLIDVRAPVAQIVIAASVSTEPDHTHVPYGYHSAKEESKAPYSTVVRSPALVWV